MKKTDTLSTKNILIVEDDMLLSLVEERLIEKLGHQVIGKATSGEEAIRKARDLEPDLILMDIILQGEVDGIEAMNEIRTFSDLPVIYLSGNSDQYNYERAKKTNFVEYLVKPITGNDLIEPFKKAFDKDQKETTTQNKNIRTLATDSGQFINKSA